MSLSFTIVASSFLSDRKVSRSLLAASLAILAVAASPSLHAHGAYHDVVKVLEEKLVDDFDNPSLHYKLAEAHAGHGEWLPCLGEIEIVERLAPGEYDTGYLRGWSLLTGGKLADAEAVLNVFLREKPDHADAWIVRGRVRMKRGDVAGAAGDFCHGLEHETDPEPDLFVEVADARVAAGDQAGAVKVLDDGIASFGPLPPLIEAALAIETRMQAWDAALGRITVMQRSAPRPEPWMAKRAALLATAGRAEESRGAWTVLHTHLLSLPNLEQGTPQNLRLLNEARQALGETAPVPVVAPPSP